eukprot:1433120-Pleurochrysis_carterae.AAC.2
MAPKDTGKEEKLHHDNRHDRSVNASRAHSQHDTPKRCSRAIHAHEAKSDQESRGEMKRSCRAKSHQAMRD